MIRPAGFAVVLAGCLIGRTPAQEFTVLTNAVDGEVRIAGTEQPVGRIRLDIQDDHNGITTAENGRFRWPIHAGSNVTAGGGNPGLNCRIYPSDTTEWSWTAVAGGTSGLSDHNRQQAREQISERAESHWTMRHGKPWLVVECSVLSTVEVVVRGPDGKLVVDRPVQVFAMQGMREFPWGFATRFTGRIDAEGRFRMRWFAGKRRLRVLVPGVGFAATGVFEVANGKTVNPDLPRLAEFGRVEGTLDPALIKPATRVEITHGNGFDGESIWDNAETVCDEHGRFVLPDVVPGTLSISLDRATNQARIEPRSMQLGPGQTVSGLVLRPEPPPRPAGPNNPQPIPIGSRVDRVHDPKQEFVWVEGIIRDAMGQPLPNSVVYARTAYHGGIRMYEDARKTTTDATGHYAIKGPVWEHMEPVATIALAGTRPPVVAYAPAPTDDPAAVRSPLDLVVADQGGTLQVTVTQDGKPVPNAWVSLTADGVAGLTQWAAGNKLTGELDPILHPKARAGLDGIARFENLFPGLYQMVASAGTEAPNPRHLGNHSRSEGPPMGVAANIGMGVGQTVVFSIALHRQPGPVQFQVIRPGARPLADESVSLECALREPGYSTFLQLDARGIGEHPFESRGLWSVDVRFLDSEVKSGPISEEPYYQAEVLLPVSPGYPLAEPVRLEGVRRERGSLRVRLLDGVGQSVRGTVFILNGPGSNPSGIQNAASTDERSEVRFTGLPSGEYPLSGTVAGLKSPFHPGPAAPYPTEDEPLRGAMAVIERSVKVEAETETFVELQAQPVGYVRGTILPPAGHKAAEYSLSLGSDQPWYPTPHRLESATGQFTLGPVPAGMHTIQVFQHGMVTPWPLVATEEVEVTNAVLHLDIHPRDVPLAASPTGRSGRVMMGMGGISAQGAPPRGQEGSVRLANGTSPAFAARALLFVPGENQPVASGVSDAAGNLTWRRRWITANGDHPANATLAQKPQAVVWLPGSTGATVVEVNRDQPIRAILPAPVTGTGQVTLGGQPMAGRDAQIRVLAAYQGSGPTATALNLEATTQSDGSFRFRGLTPGRYLVQAARDGIWLSASVEMVIEPGKVPPALALDIPEPGATMRIEVINPRGQSMAGRTLTLVRPSGPLAVLWPTTFRTDSRGHLILQGLEAGPQSLLVAGKPEPEQLLVPQLGRDSRRVETVRFVVDQ